MSPTVATVEQIAAVQDPVIRNLQITSCYCSLSSALVQRTGPTANWCTFATWASRQAGQTIRKEDLIRKLQNALHIDPKVTGVLMLIAAIIKKNNAINFLKELRAATIGHIVSQTAAKASDAVARGNKKVFEEIGFEFARFLQTAANDRAYTSTTITTFCEQLKDGDPPDGQRYLVNAFNRYYQSFFENNPKKASELRFLANLEIGFHEQTRLQPEIAESLNATSVDVAELRGIVDELIRRSRAGENRIISWLKSFIRETNLLSQHIEYLAELTESIMRKIMTAHLMTLTFPPGKALSLGHDLSLQYPHSLQQLENAEVLQLLSRIDPTPDSLVATGATDWSDLNERLHFICDLFRCYQEDTVLFEPAFTAVQNEEIDQGRVPVYFEW